MKQLILIRGLPGSGKSTLAFEHCVDAVLLSYHYEADMYFFNQYQQYNFDASKLPEAHQWCQESVDACLEDVEEGEDIAVYVSNTFTRKKELRPYFEIAKKHGIVPQVILCQNNYGDIHNVPEETYKKMKDRFEYDISDLFEEFK